MRFNLSKDVYKRQSSMLPPTASSAICTRSFPSSSRRSRPPRLDSARNQQEPCPAKGTACLLYTSTFATSQILAAAVNKIGVGPEDIVFCGRQAIDGDTAQVGPQIAEKLHLPQVTYAGEITKDGDTLTVKRMLEDGYMTIKVKTPCMITCIKELNTPRYLSVGGAFECYSKPLVTMTYDTLKDHELIDATTIGLKGSPTNILTSFTPPQKGAGMMLEGADKATTDKLAGILAAKHII